MDEPGCYLLARSGLACNKHFGVRPGSAVDVLVNPLHRGAQSQKLVAARGHEPMTEAVRFVIWVRSVLHGWRVAQADIVSYSKEAAMLRDLWRHVNTIPSCSILDARRPCKSVKNVVRGTLLSAALHQKVLDNGDFRQPLSLQSRNSARLGSSRS